MAGSQSTKTEIPEWLETPTRSAIERGEAIGKIGYTPYYGPDVAAFTPQQNAAFENNNAAANAFGLSVGANPMPAPQQFSNGMTGYSSAPLFEEAKYRLYQNAPNQYGYMNSFFVNPVEGGYGPIPPAAPGDPVAPPAASNGKGGGRNAAVAGERDPSKEPQEPWGAMTEEAHAKRAANRAAGNIKPNFGNFIPDAKAFGNKIVSDVTGLLGR